LPYRKTFWAFLPQSNHGAGYAINTSTVMTKIEYVAHESRGIRYIGLSPAAKPLASRLSLVDRILIAAVLASYTTLVILVLK
jgi:hypothetical protein